MRKDGLFEAATDRYYRPKNKQTPTTPRDPLYTAASEYSKNTRMLTKLKPWIDVSRFEQPLWDFASKENDSLQGIVCFLEETHIEQPDDLHCSSELLKDHYWVRYHKLINFSNYVFSSCPTAKAFESLNSMLFEFLLSAIKQFNQKEKAIDSYNMHFEVDSQTKILENIIKQLCEHFIQSKRWLDFFDNMQTEPLNHYSANFYKKFWQADLSIDEFALLFGRDDFMGLMKPVLVNFWIKNTNILSFEDASLGFKSDSWTVLSGLQASMPPFNDDDFNWLAPGPCILESITAQLQENTDFIRAATLAHPYAPDYIPLPALKKVFKSKKDLLMLFSHTYYKPELVPLNYKDDPDFILDIFKQQRCLEETRCESHPDLTPRETILLDVDICNTLKDNFVLLLKALLIYIFEYGNLSETMLRTYYLCPAFNEALVIKILSQEDESVITIHDSLNCIINHNSHPGEGNLSMIAPIIFKHVILQYASHQKKITLCGNSNNDVFSIPHWNARPDKLKSFCLWRYCSNTLLQNNTVQALLKEHHPLYYTDVFFSRVKAEGSSFLQRACHHFDKEQATPTLTISA